MITFLLIKHEILHMVTYDVCEKKGTIPQKLHRDAKLIKIQNSFFLWRWMDWAIALYIMSHSGS